MPAKRKSKKLRIADRDAAAKSFWIGRSQDRAASYFGLIERKGRVPSNWRSTAGLQKCDSMLRLSGVPGRKGIAKLVADRFVELQKRGVRRKVEFLDAGCALGQVIAELGSSPITRGKVTLSGLTLARPLGEKQLKSRYLALKQKLINSKERGKIEKLDFNYEQAVNELKLWQRNKAKAEKVHVGLAETQRFGKTFDLIVSTGMLEVALNPVQAVENLVNHLRVGGTAILQLGSVLPEEKMNKLAQDGFRLESFGKNVYRIDRTTRRTAKLL